MSASGLNGNEGASTNLGRGAGGVDLRRGRSPARLAAVPGESLWVLTASARSGLSA